MATEKQARAAFNDLEKAAAAFQAALDKFQAVYDPDTVGISEWKEDINDAMFEVVEDINAHFGE